MAAARNMLSGYAEPAHLNDFMFEQQRRTFSTFGNLICDHLTWFFKISLYWLRDPLSSANRLRFRSICWLQPDIL